MGRVKSTALFTFDSVKCPCFLFAKDGDGKCCNDEHEIFKIEDDHAASAVTAIAAEFFQIGKVFQARPVGKVEPDKRSFVDESPPPLHTVPLFTKHCSLVLYDDEMIA